MYDTLARVSRLTRGRFPFYKMTEYLRHKATPHYTGLKKKMWYEGHEIEVEPSKYIGGKLWWAYGRELPMMKWAHKNSRPGGFIDVGSCLGEWSLYMKRRGRFVWAFEPSPWHVPLWKYGIISSPVGLGAKPGHVDLLPSLDNEGATVPSPGTTAPIAPLDDLWTNGFPAVHLMKIDVEGMERNVLEGAQKTIQRYRPTLIIEDNVNGALELAQEWGYWPLVRMGANVGLRHVSEV
jgi:FkbM family methyltransferase